VFRGQLDTMSIYQNNVRLCPKARDLSHGVLTRFTEPGMDLLLWVSNPTRKQLHKWGHLARHCSLQGSQLGRNVDFSPDPTSLHSTSTRWELACRKDAASSALT
ncbi:mCG145064, partial [Mus musculus]